MLVADAQRDVRQTFKGGFVGQLVSGALWLASAAAASWSTPRLAILILVLGGFFIFPLTQLVLRLMAGRASLAAGNPLNGLAMQIAFTVPLSLPLVGAAALHRLDWFYPALMIVVGAHYLPFVFLYGMGSFAVLAGLMISSGTWLGMRGPHDFALGGWLTGALLLVFAFLGLMISRAEAARSAAPRRSV
jgi:hypothetical protein